MQCRLHESQQGVGWEVLSGADLSSKAALMDHRLPFSACGRHPSSPDAASGFFPTLLSLQPRLGAGGETVWPPSSSSVDTGKERTSRLPGRKELVGSVKTSIRGSLGLARDP